MATIGLLSLPNELLLDVTDNLEGYKDLNALTRANRQLYANLTKELYARDARIGKGTVLHWAAKHGVPKTAELSLAEGVDIDTRASIKCDMPLVLRIAGDQKVTPLQSAIAYERTNAAVWLIERGASTEVKLLPESAKFPLFHMASGIGLVKVMQLLLDRGAKVMDQDGLGRTPLHHAVQGHWFGKSSGSPEAVALLLQRGSKIFASDNTGFTPLDRFNESCSLDWIRKVTKRNQRLREWDVATLYHFKNETDPSAEKKIRELFEAKFGTLAIQRSEKGRARKAIKQKVREQKDWKQKDRGRKAREPRTLEENAREQKAWGRIDSERDTQSQQPQQRTQIPAEPQQDVEKAPKQRPALTWAKRAAKAGTGKGLAAQKHPEKGLAAPKQPQAEEEIWQTVTKTAKSPEQPYEQRQKPSRDPQNELGKLRKDGNRYLPLR